MYLHEETPAAPDSVRFGGTLRRSTSRARSLPMIELVADCTAFGRGIARFAAYRKIAGCPLSFSGRTVRMRAEERHDSSVKGFLGIFLGALGLFLDRAENGEAQIVVASDPVQQDAPA